MLDQESRECEVFQANVPSSALTGVLGGVVVGFWPFGSSSGSTSCSGSEGKRKLAEKISMKIFLYITHRN